jgi:hypothetical protein
MRRGAKDEPRLVELAEERDGKLAKANLQGQKPLSVYISFLCVVPRLLGVSDLLLDVSGRS